MNQTIPQQIEESFNQLSVPDQLLVIEHLVRRVHEKSRSQADDLESQLAAMAADPAIQAELLEIEREFANSNADGLEIS
jgi:hypothetical protein